MKAATAEELAANPTDPDAASVNVITIAHGTSVDGDTIEQALATHKPKWALMAHYETGSGRINDVQGFSDACLRHGVWGWWMRSARLALLIFALMITRAWPHGHPVHKKGYLACH